MAQPTSAPAADRAPQETARRYDWPLAQAAEDFLRRHLDTFYSRNSFARTLAARMARETGTDFFEWIDHFSLPLKDEPELRATGFTPDPVSETPDGELAFEHPRATLPRVLLCREQAQRPRAVALRPEFLADFMARHNLLAAPEGGPCGRYRRVLVAEENGARLEAVERRAYRGFLPVPIEGPELKAIVETRDLWRRRPRHLHHEAEGFRVATEILDEALRLVGRDLACQFFFEAERAYWESRNLAGRIQKHRQDLLGLGWGNHDHHTFRCSREHFVELIEFLSKLGFEKRERFYAGAEAGWGAQVLEQPVAGIVVFADVDLMPGETQIDFSSLRLSPAPQLGTVGLWVGLHGESLLEAGMHHLEARFEFDRLREQLTEAGVGMMKPFSDFEFLRQAFTEGERWPVRPERAERLLRGGLITAEQCHQFVKEGAIGSHLENLQRHGGFKGFNQKSVSVVISATDPRRNQLAAA